MYRMCEVWRGIERKVEREAGTAKRVGRVSQSCAKRCPYPLRLLKHNARLHTHEYERQSSPGAAGQSARAAHWHSSHLSRAPKQQHDRGAPNTRFWSPRVSCSSKQSRPAPSSVALTPIAGRTRCWHGSALPQTHNDGPRAAAAAAAPIFCRTSTRSPPSSPTLHHRDNGGRGGRRARPD